MKRFSATTLVLASTFFMASLSLSAATTISPPGRWAEQDELRQMESKVAKIMRSFKVSNVTTFKSGCIIKDSNLQIELRNDSKEEISFFKALEKSSTGDCSEDDIYTEETRVDVIAKHINDTETKFCIEKGLIKGSSVEVFACNGSKFFLDLELNEVETGYENNDFKVKMKIAETVVSNSDLKTDLQEIAIRRFISEGDGSVIEDGQPETVGNAIQILNLSL